MNNLKRKDYLIKQGEDTFELIEKYWGEKNWNMVIPKSPGDSGMLYKRVLEAHQY